MANCLHHRLQRKISKKAWGKLVKMVGSCRPKVQNLHRRIDVAQLNVNAFLMVLCRHTTSFPAPIHWPNYPAVCFKKLLGCEMQKLTAQNMQAVQFIILSNWASLGQTELNVCTAFASDSCCLQLVSGAYMTQLRRVPVLLTVMCFCGLVVCPPAASEHWEVHLISGSNSQPFCIKAIDRTWGKKGRFKVLLRLSGQPGLMGSDRNAYSSCPRKGLR